MKRVSANTAMMIGGSFAVGVMMVASAWRRQTGELERNIAQLTWIKEHPPLYCTPEEMKYVNDELARQLHFQSWNPFCYPPRVDWSDIPMDDAFVRRFYS
jgi:hypothetical protein